ncbi:MAG: TrkH family potassium uptake protein [Firmicutes bacterium]|nr:TrkH family potassium uptake protein [Bacillota bacterium]
MRIKPVLYLLSKVLLVLGGAMLLPLAVSIACGQGDALSFVYSIIPTWVSAAILFIFCHKSKNTPLRQREGFLFVTLVWLLAAFFGALPFCFEGALRLKFINALFESMSGFTTTGVTTIENIEEMTSGLLFWRAFSPWLGGAGIVLLFLLFLRGKEGSGALVQIFNAEHSGGELSEKLTARIGDGAKALGYIYIGLTIAETALLVGGGMSLFDAFTHAFGTVSTGGFSVKNASIAYYNSAYIDWVIIIFMFLSSINLGLYYLLLMREKSKIFRDEEVRVFAVICLCASLFIALDLNSHTSLANNSFGHTLREAIFQTVSVISTTGYITADYDLWPTFSRCMLFLLIFVGGCIGSTACSIKVSRIIVAFKGCRNELLGLAHPRLIKKIYFNKKPVSQGAVQYVLFFIVAFIFFTLIGTVLLSLSNLSIVDALSASLACISNVGPGLGGVGMVADYASLGAFAKCVLIFNMLIGRLEIFTVLVLFIPSVWKK